MWCLSKLPNKHHYISLIKERDSSCTTSSLAYIRYPIYLGYFLIYFLNISKLSSVVFHLCTTQDEFSIGNNLPVTFLTCKCIKVLQTLQITRISVSNISKVLPSPLSFSQDDPDPDSPGHAVRLIAQICKGIDLSDLSLALRSQTWMHEFEMGPCSGPPLSLSVLMSFLFLSITATTRNKKNDSTKAQQSFLYIFFSTRLLGQDR